jgi:hypothetical protein
MCGHGADRYLEISVGSTTLAPRVKITPAPYASFASSAGFAQRPWQSAGSNIFYNDGNVGIGTSSPAARLSLGGGDANTKLAIWQGNTASQVMGLGVGPAQFRLHLNNSGDRFSFLNAPNGSEVMTVRGDGNVGIGTWNPWYRLHVEGDGYFSGRMILGDGTPVGRLYVTGRFTVSPLRTQQFQRGFYSGHGDCEHAERHRLGRLWGDA